MFDLVFAFFHLGLLVAVLGYAVYSLVRGNGVRFVLVICLLGIYYLFVLHKPVRKEIRRRRELRQRGNIAK